MITHNNNIFDHKKCCAIFLTKRSITAAFDQKVKCVWNLTKRSITVTFDQKVKVPLGPTLRVTIREEAR